MICIFRHHYIYYFFISYSGPWGLTREILHQEGVRGLFKGLTATFMREMPGYFFFFGGYEVSRHFLTPEGKNKDEIGDVFFYFFLSVYSYSASRLFKLYIQIMVPCCHFIIVSFFFIFRNKIPLALYNMREKNHNPSKA